MHDEIKKFSLSGEVSDTVADTRERLVCHLESMMRDYGFVPSIDLDPQFTLDYKPEHEAFVFELSVYGVKVGKEKAWSISGIANGKEILRYTPKAR